MSCDPSDNLLTSGAFEGGYAAGYITWRGAIPGKGELHV